MPEKNLFTVTGSCNENHLEPCGWSIIGQQGHLVELAPSEQRLVSLNIQMLNYRGTPIDIPQIVGLGNHIDNTVCALHIRKPYPDGPWKAKHRPKSGSKQQFGQVNQRKLNYNGGSFWLLAKPTIQLLTGPGTLGISRCQHNKLDPIQVFYEPNFPSRP